MLRRRQLRAPSANGPLLRVTISEAHLEKAGRYFLTAAAGGDKHRTPISDWAREHVFEYSCLFSLGDEVDVVLETSHHTRGEGHDDHYREGIELPILKSVLYDFEEMLIDDGCTGVAVLNPRIPMEVQFDEHKILTLYGQDLDAFERVFDGHDVMCCEDIKFITEAEHVHSSTDTFAEQFEQMRYRLGIED